VLRWTEWRVSIHRLPGCAPGGRHASPQAGHPDAGRKGYEPNVVVALVWRALAAINVESALRLVRGAGFDG